MAFKKLIMVLLVSHMMVAFVSMRTADAFECYCECLSFCKRTMPWFNCTNECETHCLKLGKPRVPSDTEEYCATKTYPKHDEFLGGGGRPSTSHFKEDRSTVKAWEMLILLVLVVVSAHCYECFVGNLKEYFMCSTFTIVMCLKLEGINSEASFK